MRTSGAATRAQGLAFLGGRAWRTFLGLAGLMIALRAGGRCGGLGASSCSRPRWWRGLALLMLGVALNLSGLFEVGASLQDVGGQAARCGGLAGAAVTGALAVLVAAALHGALHGPGPGLGP